MISGVVIVVVLIAAALVAGSFRVEVDPLAPKLKRRVTNEMIGFGLAAAAVISTILWSRAYPAPHLSKGLPTILCSVIFLLIGALLTAGYFAPRHNTVFRLLSSLWEMAPGRTGGHGGLLFLGSAFGLLGLCLLVVGVGLLG
jgi:hypothetical protein